MIGSLLLGVLVGCAAPLSAGPAVAENDQQTARLNLDPRRAYLSLSEIEPVVMPPIRAEGLKPLSERSLRKVDLARSLADRQRYTEASLELERALRYDPNHPDIHAALARIHFLAGNLERARTHALAAIAANADKASAHYIVAEVCAEDGDPVEAMTAYRKALLCTDFGADMGVAASCHRNLAHLLAEAGYLSAAVEQCEAFEQTVQRLTEDEAAGAGSPPVVADRFFKVGLLERLGRYDEALAALGAVATDVRQDAAADFRRARLLMKTGDLQEALATARTIPLANESGILELLAEIHERSGHPERMVEDLHARIAEQPAEARFLELVDWLLSLSPADQAEREMRRYLVAHPDAEKVRSRLLEVLIARSAWDEALREAAAAIRRHPHRGRELARQLRVLAGDTQAVEHLLAEAWTTEDYASSYLLGFIALSAGQLDEAEKSLVRSRELEPSFVPARAALARVYLQTYRYDDALRAAARADDARVEDRELETILGLVYERLDRVEEAELHFRAAVDHDREATEARFALAEVYLRARRENQGRQQLRVLLEIDPAHEEARELLAGLYLREGKTTEAIAQYKALAQATKDPRAVARCAALLAQFDTPAPAAYRETLLAAMARHGADAATWLALAGSYDEFEYEQAGKAYRHALELEPASERATLGLISTEWSSLNFEETIGLWESILPRRPNRHAWRRHLIEAHRVIGDTDKALSLASGLEARTDLDASSRWQYRVTMVEILRQTGRREEAIARLKAWAEAAPDQPEWAQRLAAAYVDGGQPDRAVPILERLCLDHPGEDLLVGPLLDALIEAGRYERADQYVLDHLNDNPENEDLLRMFLGVLARSKRTDQALELINSKLLDTRNRLSFQISAITLLDLADRHEECLERIEAAIDEQLSVPSPEQAGLDHLRRLLILKLIDVERYEEAERLLYAWIAQTTQRGTLFGYLKLLSRCQDARGLTDQAVVAKQRALALQPDDVMLNNDLAYSWIDQGVRLDDAEPMIRYALSSAPRQSAYLDTYGWLMYKRGEFAEAKKWLTRALRAEPERDPVILDHLGDACWRLGLKDEAVEHWSEAVRSLSERKEEPGNADERRVVESTAQKIEAAKADGTPQVAALAAAADDEGTE